MVKRVKKDKKIKVKEPSDVAVNVKPTDIEDATLNKQFTVFYSVGNEQNFFVTHGDYYNLTTLDIKSPINGEVFAFPVILVVDIDKNSGDIIPMNQIGNLRYNWGFKEEVGKFAAQVKALQESMQKKEKDTKSGHDSQYV